MGKHWAAGWPLVTENCLPSGKVPDKPCFFSVYLLPFPDSPARWTLDLTLAHQNWNVQTLVPSSRKVQTPAVMLPIRMDGDPGVGGGVPWAPHSNSQAFLGQSSPERFLYLQPNHLTNVFCIFFLLFLSPYLFFFSDFSSIGQGVLPRAVLAKLP